MQFVIQQAVAAVLDELVQLEAAGRLRVIRGRATWRARANGKGVDVVIGDTRVLVDRAVCATGFVSTLPRLWGAPDLRTLVDRGDARMLGVVDGAPSALAIGRSLVVGAALEELVPAGFDEPPYAGALLRANPIVDALLGRTRRSTTASARVPLLPGERGHARVKVPATERAEAHASTGWTALLDVQLALSGFDLRPLGTRALAVRLRASGPVLDVDVTGLARDSVRLFAAALPGRVRRAVRRWGSLAFDVRVSRGRIR